MIAVDSFPVIRGVAQRLQQSSRGKAAAAAAWLSPSCWAIVNSYSGSCPGLKESTAKADMGSVHKFKIEYKFSLLVAMGDSLNGLITFFIPLVFQIPPEKVF